MKILYNYEKFDVNIDEIKRTLNKDIEEKIIF